MILVDTSVWIDHLHRRDDQLAELLVRGEVLGHPWVTGEVALGSLAEPDRVLAMLDGLPRAPVATPAELRALVDHEQLGGSGIGYVDLQILAAARLAPGARLWTRDRRLAEIATLLAVGWKP